jgi:hypothetical protein
MYKYLYFVQTKECKEACDYSKYFEGIILMYFLSEMKSKMNWEQVIWKKIK